jgi:hypothetical protein
MAERERHRIGGEAMKVHHRTTDGTAVQQLLAMSGTDGHKGEPPPPSEVGIHIFL